MSSNKQRELTKTAYILVGLLLVLMGVFFLTEVWPSLVGHVKRFCKWMSTHNKGYYPWIIWFAIGAAVFPLMNRFLKKNIDMVKTFTHELTHIVAAFLTFRRIHSFHAEEKSGVVHTSGNNKYRFMVSLAPYCFPIYTFPLLALRCIVSASLFHIMDILIGFTTGLHIICFKEQTGNHQPDIQNHPFWVSYLYIAVILIFDICLILLSYEPSSNIFYAFKTLGIDLWNDLTFFLR